MWIAALLLAVPLFCLWQNSRAAATEIEFNSRLVPRALDGFRIAHLSDVHGRPAGGAERLLALLRDKQPGLIAITGDLLDRQHPDAEGAAAFVRALADIAPVCFAAGNHECRSGRYDELRRLLKQTGVHVLDDAAVTVTIGDRRFTVAGLRDPAFSGARRTAETVRQEREETLKRLWPDDGAFCMLLSHRPELFDIYLRCGVPLTLSGHAHGGQVRLFGRGLYAPGQGVFPRYTGGMYRRGDAAMIVSRGLGGRFTRLRLFNRPEVVMVTLGAQ